MALLYGRGYGIVMTGYGEASHSGGIAASSPLTMAETALAETPACSANPTPSCVHGPQSASIDEVSVAPAYTSAGTSFLYLPTPSSWP
jgi:hypothetical protein